MNRQILPASFARSDFRAQKAHANGLISLDLVRLGAIEFVTEVVLVNMAYLLSTNLMHPSTKRSISAAARPHRPTNIGWQTGLISLDLVRLGATKRANDADLRWIHVTGGCSEISCFFQGWRIGWNEGRSVFSKKTAELSEIIMEINDLRRVARAPDRPEQERRRFCNRAFRR